MKRLFLKTVCAVSLLVTTNGLSRDMDMFKKENTRCYDRDKEPYTFAVDAHTHFRAFGGPAVAFPELVKFYKRKEIFFVNIFGIGQRLPTDSECTYYLSCPDQPVLPSITNDFVNGANVADYKPKEFHATLSMTFPDLANPDDILQKMDLLDKEFPNMFSWMGEVNIVKQAIFPNRHEPVPFNVIPKWKPFMDKIRERNMPITFHSDIGKDGTTKDQTMYLALMEEVLETYPDNIIVWAHLGLSKELKTLDPRKHISILTRLLNKYPKLYLDFSWRVVTDNYFNSKANVDLYVKFFNKYYDRILPGTDFVASIDKDTHVLSKEVDVNSYINKYLDDRAFRYIALGENFFRLLNLEFKAPKICKPRNCKSRNCR